MNEPKKVQWPAKATDSDGDDLRAPLEHLLKGLKLDKPPSDGGAPGVIESTTLEITKQVKALITGAGGTTAVAGAATGVWAAVSDKTPLAIALAAGVAFVLAASILGLAKVMDGDVRGRAAVTTEQVRARAEVATAFLKDAAKGSETRSGGSDPESAGTTPKPALAEDLRVALAAYGDRLEIDTADGSSRVCGISWSPSGLRIRLDSGDSIDVSEATGFRVAS